MMPLGRDTLVGLALQVDRVTVEPLSIFGELLNESVMVFQEQKGHTLQPFLGGLVFRVFACEGVHCMGSRVSSRR